MSAFKSEINEISLSFYIHSSSDATGCVLLPTTRLFFGSNMDDCTRPGLENIFRGEIKNI